MPCGAFQIIGNIVRVFGVIEIPPHRASNDIMPSCRKHAIKVFMSDQPQTPFEDDPILGEFIAYYPANRLRLIIIGTGILLVVWFVITVSLWNIPPDEAWIATIIVIMVAALLVGWWMLHLWNREVTVYRYGFSYRRGSQVAYIRYSQIRDLRQSGGLMTYFGGMIRHNTYRLHLTTDQDEFIVIDAIYERAEQLTRQIEAAITQTMLRVVRDDLARGERVRFGAGVAVSAQGVHHHAELIMWEAVGGYTLGGGALNIHTSAGEVWRRLPLAELVNVPLLVALLKAHILAGDVAEDKDDDDL